MAAWRCTVTSASLGKSTVCLSSLVVTGRLRTEGAADLGRIPSSSEGAQQPPKDPESLGATEAVSSGALLSLSRDGLC